MMQERRPSPTAANGHGRGPGGRFGTGNGFARGNPHAKRVAQLRAVLLEAVSDDDMQAVMRALVDAAKGGEVAAIRELLDRCVGKVAEGADLLDRLAELEAVIKGRGPVAPASGDLHNHILPPGDGEGA